MQAARNFVVNGRYAEARRVLDGMTARNARWYYLSSLANQGLGNSIDALQDARRAAQMDPGNTEYQMHLRNLQDPIPQVLSFGKRFLQKNPDFFAKDVLLLKNARQRSAAGRSGMLVPITRSGRSAATGTCGCAACGWPLPRSGAHVHG